MRNARRVEQSTLLDQRLPTVVDGMMIGGENRIDAGVGEDVQLLGAGTEVEKIFALVDARVADGRNRAHQIDDANVGSAHRLDIDEMSRGGIKKVHSTTEIDVAAEKYCLTGTHFTFPKNYFLAECFS